MTVYALKEIEQGAWLVEIDGLSGGGPHGLGWHMRAHQVDERICAIATFTRPPFAHPMGPHEVGDSSPLGSGRHHFFPKRSFSAALSSIASANMRFSLAFTA